MTDSCAFIYDGRSGGRKGEACGRPESDHCHAKPVCDSMKDHHPECRYAAGNASRAMVHHVFHRRSKT